MSSFDDVEKALPKGPVVEVKTIQHSATSSSHSSTKSLNKKKAEHENRLRVFQALVGIQFLDVGGVQLSRRKRRELHHRMHEGSYSPTNRNKDHANEKRSSSCWNPFRRGPTRRNLEDEIEDDSSWNLFKQNHIHWRNRGLYERAVSQERANRILCTMSYYIITCLYLLQILLAATFTALSSYQQSLSRTLTGLGAANTIVAGILAWLTGQGMPIRFRRARDRYRCVVKAIEMSERTFAEIDLIDWKRKGLKEPHPVDERDKLEKMFEDARIDQEANYPEVHYDHAAQQMSQHNKDYPVLIEKLTKMLKEKGVDLSEAEAPKENE